ncbi:DUF2515 family protein [Herbaspirillum huttiense]|uniref:DUF2515 family protein n=1 Tax=Herbaspirillum huttiense TaxID=863372 RepID=UPI003CD0B7D4
MDACRLEGEKDAWRRPSFVSFLSLLSFLQGDGNVVLKSIWLNWASPKLSLVFSSACDTREAHLESLASDDTVLEDVESRMIWIKRAADSFHSLMQNKSHYVEAELLSMAGWVTMEDRQPPLMTPPQLHRP